MGRCREERPGWKQERRNHWRKTYQEAKDFTYYSQANLNRMRLGLAPQRKALLRHIRTGIEIEQTVSLELHHVFGLFPNIPQSEQTYIECWPWQHATMDDSRKFPYEFVEWSGNQ